MLDEPVEGTTHRSAPYGGRLPDARIGLHLHDTRGAGLACFLAALRLGVTLFDGSVGGLGGCPFAETAHGAAAGNVCTEEDMVFMAHEMGVATGIDLDALIEAARMAERIVGHALPGKVMHSGPPRRKGIAAQAGAASTTGSRSSAVPNALPV